jgi:predicted amino acid dehydrogenase
VTSPFGFTSTAADVIDGIDLHGRRALVTGAASGIGMETARALASAGAETFIAARDTYAVERVAADIRTSTGNQAVTVAQLDLLDRASIDRLSSSTPVRCTSWSITPGSWPSPSFDSAPRGTNSSSPPTTSATSASPWAC